MKNLCYMHMNLEERNSLFSPFLDRFISKFQLQLSVSFSSLVQSIFELFLTESF